MLFPVWEKLFVTYILKYRLNNRKGFLMKLATTIGNLYRYCLTPAEALRAAAKSGFRYIDYSFYSAHTGNSPYLANDDRMWKKEVEDAAAAAAELNIKYVQAHAPGCNPAGEGDHSAEIRAVNRTIEACGMLGIRNTVLHTSYSRKHLYPADRDAYFEFNRKFLEQLLPTAEKHNVTICVENSTSGNMGDMYFFMTPAEMNDFIDFMGHPLVAACWDTGHALMEGKPDQSADFKELGKNLRAVHIHDNNGRDSHLAPYCGGLMLDKVMEGLLAIPFDGYFTFEADGYMSKCNGDGPLACASLDICVDALALLYKVGRRALETYNCFEE